MKETWRTISIRASVIAELESALHAYNLYRAKFPDVSASPEIEQRLRCARESICYEVFAAANVTDTTSEPKGK